MYIFYIYLIIYSNVILSNIKSNINSVLKILDYDDDDDDDDDDESYIVARMLLSTIHGANSTIRGLFKGHSIELLAILLCAGHCIAKAQTGNSQVGGIQGQCSLIKVWDGGWGEPHRLLI